MYVKFVDVRGEHYNVICAYCNNGCGYLSLVSASSCERLWSYRPGAFNHDLSPKALNEIVNKLEELRCQTAQL